MEEKSRTLNRASFKNWCEKGNQIQNAETILDIFGESKPRRCSKSFDAGEDTDLRSILSMVHPGRGLNKE